MPPLSGYQWKRLKEAVALAHQICGARLIRFDVSHGELRFQMRMADSHSLVAFPLRELDFDARNHDEHAKWQAEIRHSLEWGLGRLDSSGERVR